MGPQFLQPTDLLFAPDDPFESLDGYDPALPYRSISLLDPRILVVRLFRTQTRSNAEAAAIRLGHWLAEGRYRGLIFDYRGAHIDHDPDTFPAIANAMAGAFPAGLSIVYLQDSGTFLFARLMVRLLRDRGARSARVKSFDAAWEAITARRPQ